VDSAAIVQDLTANLFEFQKSGYLCDTLILADDGQVKAHSAVLAAASPVFKQVLKNSYQSLPHVVILPGIQLGVVNSIVQFMYTGKIIIPSDNGCSSTKVINAIRDLGIKLHIARYVCFISRLCEKFNSFLCTALTVLNIISYFSRNHSITACYEKSWNIYCWY